MGWRPAPFVALLAIAAGPGGHAQTPSTAQSPAMAVAATAVAATAAAATATTATATTATATGAVAAPLASRPAPKAAPKVAHGDAHKDTLVDLDWRELLPENERAGFTGVAPPPMHDSRGEGGPPAVQAQDFNINKSLEGSLVRLPGFIVPLEAVGSGNLREFLLVPYFGSCIHVPPPPPNQLVYVRTSGRVNIESIYDAYWITGRLHVQTRHTRLGSAAYELIADKVEVYKY
ncbi:MAG TPA: DUF3299 domain-containing protein [Steroidobacteraceae bacterium]|nr:DUF3299 domain-containing protein [Steroidobacteraceae bacterium]